MGKRDFARLEFEWDDPWGGWISYMKKSLGPDSVYIWHLTSTWDSIAQIRSLISKIGFPTLVRQHLHIESGRWNFLRSSYFPILCRYRLLPDWQFTHPRICRSVDDVDLLPGHLLAVHALTQQIYFEIGVFMRWGWKSLTKPVLSLGQC